MGLILDSSLLIADERGLLDLRGFLATFDEPVALSAITASELLHGCHRAPDGRIKRKRTKYVEWVLAEFDVVPFALEEARQHARIWAHLMREGRTTGAHDLQIAATALSQDFTLATLNSKDFTSIPDIRLIDNTLLRPFQTK